MIRGWDLLRRWAAHPRSGDLRPHRIDCRPRPSSREQDIDFLTGSLFLKFDPGSAAIGNPLHPSNPGPGRLRALHVASPLRLEGITKEPLIQLALARLAAVYPMTLTKDELAADPSAK